VGVQRRGLLGGRDSELQDRHPVSRRISMVRKPGQVALFLWCLAQCCKDASMEEPTTERRDGRQDSFTSQFVAEGQAISGSPQETTSDALIGFVEDRASNSQQETWLDCRTDHGCHVEDCARFGREASGAGQHGITDRRWHHLALTSEDLGHEERIACGEPVEGGGVTAAIRCHLLHRVLRQRADAYPVHGRCRDQIPQDQAKGVLDPDLVVAVGDHDEDREISKAPAEEAQQLDRSAIGPVGIFGDDDCWSRSRGEGRQHLSKEPVPGLTVERLLVNA
jgi:hypothetical protein